MRIFLIGMPGSGKSTIARYLSEALGMPIYDLDKLIEAKAGKTIPMIFDQVGEEGFRQLEQEALGRLIDEHEQGIIATGGGAPCFFDNLDRMKRAGKTVYLEAPLATLIARTSRSAKRPLLKESPADKVTKLLDQREAIYRQADIVFSTQGRDSLEVARDLAELLAELKT